MPHSFFASCALATVLLSSLSLARAAEGDLDPSFGAEGGNRGADDAVFAAAVKADGKVVIGGLFTTYDDLPRRRVAQLNPDGSVDATFNPGTGVLAPDGTTNNVQDVRAVAAQADGKILIGGFFTGYNGTPVKSLARINPNGSLDATFNAGNVGLSANGTVEEIIVQGDGRIVIAGYLESYNGIARNNVARLNADGTLDRTFNEGIAPGTNGPVSALALQSDGKLIIAGSFQNVRGTPRNRVARLDAEGRLDATFDPGTGADQQIFGVAVQSDGKILLGGFFSSFNGVARNAIARLNANGSLDTTFDPGVGPDGVVYQVAVQFDGKILLAGAFNSVNGVANRAALARLNANGTDDTSFAAGLTPGSSADVRGLALQVDGKIIIGGLFTDYQGIQRNRVARLFSAPRPIADPGPPLPAATGFTVNDSATGVPVARDSVLRMRVTQPSTAARLAVRVQSSVTPADEASWTDLNNGSFGRMIFDVTNETYVLNTTTYPRVTGVHFRALSSAPGHAASSSNVVGPFDLTSSTPHLGRTILSTTRNGPGAVINFRAFDEAHPSGVSMRIQSATSPGDESNWTDLADGNGGRMARYRNPGDFYLDSNKYPANGALYFRAVASAPGYIDSPSRGVGPFNLINSPSPAVSVNSPGLSGAGLGTDFEFPVPLPAGAFTVSANAMANGGPAIKTLRLLYDGQTIESFNASSGSRSFTPPAPGDHVVEASAVDELGVTGDAIPVHVRIAPAGGKVFQRLADGAWSDPARWLDAQGNSGVPGPGDLAIVGDFRVALSAEVTALAVGLHGGSLEGPGALTITGTLTISRGTISLPNLTITPSGSMLLVNEEDVAFSGTIENQGATNLIGRAGITGIRNTGGVASKAAVGRNGFFDGVAAFFRNAGQFLMGRRTGGKREARPSSTPVPETPRNVLVATFENNGGRIISNDGASILANDGASLIGQDGAGIISNDGASIISNDGASIISNDGASLIGQDGAGIVSGGGGNIISGGAGNFIPGHQPARAAANESNIFRQTAGSTDLSGIRLIGPVLLQGGILNGQGQIAGDLTNDGGYLAPGHSAGAISVSGNFTQSAGGTLLLEVGGTNAYAPQFDQLKVAGVATLDGQLSLRTIAGFTPDPHAPLVPLSYGSASGAFASTSGNLQVALRSTGASLTVSGANPVLPTLRNISSRMRVETGDNVLIGGFIITGSAPKKVILRAIGPSLPLADRLGDTTLELFKPDGSRVFNDNWRSTQEAEIIASTVPPSNDLESAIVATLSPGAHTAIVRGQGSATGVAVIEIYDLEPANPELLANISTRGRVLTGDNVMIGGFIIGGPQPASVLVRAVGPSLPVAGRLEDPELSLFNSNGSAITNDDWRATQESEIIATTVPPSDAREAAIVATLVPGAYTAIVRGKNGSTGVALVEVYDLR